MYLLNANKISGMRYLLFHKKGFIFSLVETSLEQM